MSTIESNQEWSDRIRRRYDPSFRHRWEAFNALLVERLGPGRRWLDVGCGDNEQVARFGHLAEYAVGVDLLPSENDNGALFVQSDLRSIPFPDASFDVITLRFVVEHIPHVPEDFQEIIRLLRPGGSLLILTTNSHSPFVLPLRVLPFRLKNLLIRSLLKVRENDIFPTYHRFNTVARMKRGVPGLELESIQLIQDANFTRRWLFLVLFGVHLVSRPKLLQRVRPNIIAEFRRSVGVTV
jgi:ubiquinone/menaquinone biosynthesis C-methylase UbiE